MTTILRNLWQSLLGQRPAAPPAEAVAPASPPRPAAASLALDIAPNDPLALFFQTSPGAVEVDKLHFDSPALQALKAANARLLVPLVSQGELIGLLSLGPRLSEQDYSTDDRALLSNLASQAAPAVRVAQLVRQQQLEVQARERLEQELRVARLIQQTLLPKELPTLAGWEVAAYYQPARAVGGDFYDFIPLSGGRLAFVVGDVTDKGVPAALLMATTRANLRAAAQRFDNPGEVLAHVNEVLCPDIPPNMFITCLYAVLDPERGELRFANAGHDLPYVWSPGHVEDLRARGMPLGLMPGMVYEEKAKTIAPGESVLFYSDGLVEAHNPQREMFGFPRLSRLLEQYPGGPGLIAFLLEDLQRFTGADWEQEDDTTLVLLQRAAADAPVAVSGDQATAGWKVLEQFAVPSEPGNEREAIRRVATAVQGLPLPAARVEKLKTAVAEAIMNAIEHGNHNQPELPVDIAVLVAAGGRALAVRITDKGGGRPLPVPELPDLDAKLAGAQSPRGWGLFLIGKMVDRLNVATDEVHHTLELIMDLEGGEHGH
jgi:serine phosphatase RsbU (regulator of sigma subunit)/anti-sigma regulatory factor (Ser/Thr protein kinase)